MKKLFIIMFIILAACPMQAAKTDVNQLTLEEKIGQMMQLVTDLFGTNDAQGVFHIDYAKADTLFSKYKIGSILNAPNTCAPTAPQWEEIISDIQKLSMKHIGIPCVFGLDQNHGSTYTQGGTLFPQNINVGATFNRNIALKSAEATAYETRAVSVPWSGKDRTPAYISPSDLREKHFAPFLAAIREGAASVMVNSASVNGMPVHANHELLTVWLKEQTGWDGVLITDWADINNLYTRERVAKDKKEALCIAINAGIDMIMEPYSVDACILLKELVEEGKVPMSRIDDAVSRILRMKERLGLYKHPTQRLKDYPKFGGKEFSQQYNTIYEALCNEYGQQNVVLCQGVTYNEQGKYWEENTPDIEAAVRAAKDVDVIVACIGENSYTETPGNYGGDALALLLAGKRNFSGRLPYTYPSEINSLANYDFKKSEEVGTMEGAYDYNARITQQWAFGYGKSYTTFKYSNLKVDKQHFTKDDVLQVSVDVKNTGKTAGKESVLLYSSDLVATMTPDGRRLRQFDKVELQPGETRTVTLQLKASDLAFVGYDGRWTLEEGDFDLSIGTLTTRIVCDQTYTWTSANKK